MAIVLYLWWVCEPTNNTPRLNYFKEDLWLSVRRYFFGRTSDRRGSGTLRNSKTLSLESGFRSRYRNQRDPSHIRHNAAPKGAVRPSERGTSGHVRVRANGV